MKDEAPDGRIRADEVVGFTQYKYVLLNWSLQDSNL